MRLPDVTPEPGASAASNPATPVRKHGGMALVAGGDDTSVEAVLQSLSPTSVKSVVSQAAADAVGPCSSFGGAVAVEQHGRLGG